MKKTLFPIEDTITFPGISPCSELRLKELNDENASFKTTLFLPENKNRIAEGGLRKKGIFKNNLENKPLVSIITVVLNGSAYFEQTLLSVLNQDYNNIEYIVIDGGSTDGTLELIKKYSESIDYWISEPDAGVYAAMNKGISCVLGELVGIINCSDYYYPTAITNIIKSGIRNYGIFYSNVSVIEEGGDTVKSNIIPNKNLTSLKKFNCLFHPSSFVKISVYKKIGLYDEKFSISADYKFFLKAFLDRIPFLYVNHLTSAFRNGGLSSGFTIQNLTENIRLRRQLGIWPYRTKEFIIFIWFRLINLLQ